MLLPFGLDCNYMGILWEAFSERERESQDTGANDVQLQLYSSLK